MKNDTEVLKSSAREAKNLLELCGGDLYKSVGVLERQLNVLQTRAQVLMSLAGVVLTITGFSGRRIADTSLFAQICVITGLAVVLTSAVWVWKNVLGISWTTSRLDESPEDVLTGIIIKRQKKTRSYIIGGYILCAGFVIYSLAFAKMLLFNA
jgi:hypothetical protein